MSQERTEIFIEWLDAIEKERGWTDYRLAVETKLSSSVFSKARQGILPKWDALIRIANATKKSPITAFRKAGLLPDGGENVTFEDWQYLLTELDPQDEAELRQIAELKIERRRKEKELKSLKPKRTG
jgi:transcriptional regulator with XRE-family HTH domain